MMYIIKKIVFFLLAVILAFYGAEFFSSRNYIVGKWQFTFIMGYFLLMQCIIYFLTKTFRDHLKKQTVMVLIIVSGFLACLFRDSMLITFLQEEVTVYVTAVGEKNEKSQGAEVWISQVIVDGENVDLSTVWHDDVWKYDEVSGYLYADPKGVASTIELSFHKAKEVSFLLREHGWSGMVEIKDTNQNIQILDLYSKDDEVVEYTIEIPRETSQHWKTVSYVGSWLWYYMILVVGLFILSCLMRKDNTKQN